MRSTTSHAAKQQRQRREGIIMDDEQKNVNECLKDLSIQVKYAITQLSWEFLHLKTHLEKEIRDTQKMIWEVRQLLQKDQDKSVRRLCGKHL
jgi:gas vesicle protein